MPGIIYGMKILDQNVQGITLTIRWHWIPEEQPVFVRKFLNNFLTGAETSK